MLLVLLLEPVCQQPPGDRLAAVSCCWGCQPGSYSSSSTPLLPSHVLCAWWQVFLYINSPGGVVTAGLAIYDTMQVSGQSGVQPRFAWRLPRTHTLQVAAF